MRVARLHPFDLPRKDALRLQSWLAAKVVEKGSLPRRLRLVAGLDCAVDRAGHVHGVVVVCAAPDWHVVETVSASAPALMPYVSGLLSFREAPILLDALRKLRSKPDLLLVDGQGIAHPRGLGLAAHIGLHVAVPVVGVAKSRLCGTHAKPGKKRGDWVELRAPRPAHRRRADDAGRRQAALRQRRATASPSCPPPGACSRPRRASASPSPSATPTRSRGAWPARPPSRRRLGSRRGAHRPFESDFR